MLRAAHEGALTHCSLADLKRFAVESGVIGGERRSKGDAMRDRMLLLYVSAGAGILTAATFSAAPRAQALPSTLRHHIRGSPL
jgi:hypothetical protein